jgi:hypothetical protein
MNNDEEKTEIVPVTTSDDWDGGFSDDSDSGRLLQGSHLPCVDGDWTFKDGAAFPKDKRLFVLGTAEGQQHWEAGQLVEERVKKPCVPFAETIDALNAKIPQNEWAEAGPFAIPLTGKLAIGNALRHLSSFGHCMVLKRISSLAGSRRL